MTQICPRCLGTRRTWQRDAHGGWSPDDCAACCGLGVLDGERWWHWLVAIWGGIAATCLLGWALRWLIA